MRLYTEIGREEACWFSGRVKNPKKKACKKYKQGPPFVPSFDGRMSKVVTFNPEKTSSFTFYTNEDRCLVLTWDAKGKYWRVHAVTIDEAGGLVSKQFGPEEYGVAFTALVELIGAAENSIYSSIGVNQKDEVDEDGFISNKPKELRIYPLHPKATEHR